MTERILIVGAGFTGSTIARTLADHGVPSRIVDRRPYAAGNAHDPIHSSGVRYHLHGPHAFHTNSQDVVAYLSKFTSWHPYEHRVRGLVDGIEIPIPFNYSSLELLLPQESAQLMQILNDSYGAGNSVTIQRFRESKVAEVQELAEFIFEKVFVGYTRKQWGMDPEKLGPSVLGRVPVRLDFDDRYFQDDFQAMPLHGYQEMFSSMLDHSLIDLELDSSVTLADLRKWDSVFFTGPLDELFDYSLGELGYRSLDFTIEERKATKVLTTAQLNFPGNELHTRVSEFKSMTGQKHPNTVLAWESPKPHIPQETEPYYPIPTESFRDLHKAYLSLASEVLPQLLPVGRLADYRYYNMDQAVARALSVARQFISARPPL